MLRKDTLTEDYHIKNLHTNGININVNNDGMNIKMAKGVFTAFTSPYTNPNSNLSIINHNNFISEEY